MPKKKRVRRAPAKLWVTPVRAEMEPQRAMQTGRYMEGFPTWLRNMFLSHRGAEVNERSDVDHGRESYEGTCMVMYPT